MSDVELLKLAAKAMKLNVKGLLVDEDDHFRALIVGKKNTKERITWNPLVDNNDSMILAVEFEMDINHSDSFVSAAATYKSARVGIFSALIRDSRITATRKAIVMAAARIGETL